VALTSALHPILGTAVEAIIVYWCISIRSLKHAAMDVCRELRRGDLLAARRAVAMIVGRETRHLDETGVSRAAVETVAENLVDGVISPMCYAAIGGAPLAAAFKMVSTLDSMIGYRNRRYERFGKTAARLDDALNYVPARLSVVLIAVAAQLLGRRGGQAVDVARKDGARHLSPNAGLPEAAFAGALAVCLGGPNTYQGQTVEKPFIGGRYPAAGPTDIPRACALMVTSALLCVPAAILIHAAASLFWTMGGGSP
jgi:adenosylcobinamide-phosphate synthase